MTTIDGSNPFYTGNLGQVTTDKQANSLGQQEFLVLLTTQLQNQDPLSPMDNTEFISQMAQFSTVEGIDRVNASVTSLGDMLGGNRVSTAASLLGHSVLVPGNMARVDDQGEIHGMAELSSNVSSMTVTYTDPNTNQPIHVQELGAQVGGMIEFGWDEVPPAIQATNGQVRVSIMAEAENGTISVPVSVFARVDSALGGPTSDTITLLVEDYGALDTTEVTAFR